MSANYLCLVTVISFLWLNSTWAQTSSLQGNSFEISNKLSNSLSLLETCHYTAEMKFKEMGSDTFEVRNFIISFKRNAGNPLYGYDWEITEKLSNGYMHTFMLLQDGLYIIYEGTKMISKRPLPWKIDQGSRRFPFLIRMIFFISNAQPRVR